MRLPRSGDSHDQGEVFDRAMEQIEDELDSLRIFRNSIRAHMRLEEE